MATIIPDEKKMRDALEWMSINRGQKSDKELIKEASFRFNLNPKEENYLRKLFEKEVKDK
jgi:hypothetical protein